MQHHWNSGKMAEKVAFQSWLFLKACSSSSTFSISHWFIFTEKLCLTYLSRVPHSKPFWMFHFKPIHSDQVKNWLPKAIIRLSHSEKLNPSLICCNERLFFFFTHSLEMWTILKKKLSHLTETKSVILFYLLFPIVVAFLATRDHIATHFVIFFKSAKIKSVKIRSLTAKSDVLSNKVRSHKLRESLCETDREKNWCKTK